MSISTPRRSLWILAAGHFALDSYNGYLAPLLPLLIAKHGMSVAVAASLASVLSVSSSGLQPLFGYLADRHRWRVFAWLSPFVTGFFISLLGVAPNYAALATFLFLSGLGTAAFHPLAAASAHAVAGERKGHGMSIFVTGGNVGHSLGPVIILPVVMLIGLERSWVMMLPALVVSLLLYFWAPDPKHEARIATSGSLSDLRTRWLPLTLLWLLVTLRAVVIAGFSNFMPILLRSHGTALFLAGSSITIFQLTGSAGSFLGGALSDRIGRLKTLVLSFSLPVPLFLAFLAVRSDLRLVLIALAGFAIFLSIPANLVEAQNLFPRNLSTVSSLMIGLAWGTAGLLLTPLGVLADRFGITAMLTGLSFATLFGVLLTGALWAALRKDVGVPEADVADPRFEPVGKATPARTTV